MTEQLMFGFAVGYFTCIVTVLVGCLLEWVESQLPHRKDRCSNKRVRKKKLS